MTYNIAYKCTSGKPRDRFRQFMVWRAVAG
jgi:hypothetical protein